MKEAIPKAMHDNNTSANLDAGGDRRKAMDIEKKKRQKRGGNKVLTESCHCCGSSVFPLSSLSLETSIKGIDARFCAVSDSSLVDSC